jgi:hypothetical protein
MTELTGGAREGAAPGSGDEEPGDEELDAGEYELKHGHPRGADSDTAPGGHDWREELWDQIDSENPR